MRLEKLLRISSSLNLYRTEYINQLLSENSSGVAFLQKSCKGKMTWETHSRNRKNKGDVSHKNFVHWLFELSLYLFQLVNNSVWKINYMHKHQQYLNYNFGINLAYQCTACVSVYAQMFSDKWRSYQAGHDLKSIIIIFRLPSKESPSSCI